MPEQLNGDSIARQHCVFLVTITDEGQEGQLPVRVSAKAPGSEVAIYQQDVVQGQIAQVVVTPAQASTGKTIEEWEVHLEWHVTMPPHDWAKIDLRHRFDELEPSYASEISSLNADSEPLPIEPPEAVWR